MLHFLIGTRAQLIKTAPLMRECTDRGVAYNFIFLPQHQQTIAEMIDMFGIKKPDRILGRTERDITTTGTLMTWFVRVLAQGIREGRRLFLNDRQGIVVVHGDALPVLIGAVFGKCAGLRVAHVEAGLRSFSFLHPFPEELIRVLTWKMGMVDYFFCPNPTALRHVAAYSGSKYDTGANTLLDALQMAEAAESRGNGPDLPQEKYALVTLHRFESISNRAKMLYILDILDRISRKLPLLFILHPPTLKSLAHFGLIDLLKNHPRIQTRERYGYFPFIRLLKHSEFVISDGGSNQEECFYLGHPCLLLRSRTERPEGLGENVLLSGFDPQRIDHFTENYRLHRRPSHQADRSPSREIIDILLAKGTA